MSGHSSNECPVVEMKVSKALSEKLLKQILGQEPPPRSQSSLPVKSGGLGIRDPTITSNRNYQTSRVMVEYIIEVKTGEAEFEFETHKVTVGLLRSQGKKAQDALDEQQWMKNLEIITDEAEKCWMLRT